MREGTIIDNPMAYEFMTPEMVGARRSRLVLSRHSGRQSMLHRLRELGYADADIAGLREGRVI